MRIIFFIFILFVSKSYSQTNKWQLETFVQLNQINFFNQVHEVINPQNLLFINNSLYTPRPSVGFSINKISSKCFQHSFRFNSFKVGGNFLFDIVTNNPNFPAVITSNIGIELITHQLSYTMRTNVLNLFEEFVAKQGIDVKNRKLNLYIGIGGGINFRHTSYDGAIGRLTDNFFPYHFTTPSGKKGVVDREIYDEARLNYFFNPEITLQLRLSKRLDLGLTHFKQYYFGAPLFRNDNYYEFDDKLVGSTRVYGPGNTGGWRLSMYYTLKNNTKSKK